MSNYKGFPACQAERIQNESRERFKRLSVSRIKAHRVVLDTREYALMRCKGRGRKKLQPVTVQPLSCWLRTLMEEARGEPIR